MCFHVRCCRVNTPGIHYSSSPQLYGGAPVPQSAIVPDMSSSHVVCGIIQGIKRIGCLVGAPHAQQKGWRASPRVGPALRPLWLGIAVATLNAWAQTSTPPVLPKVEPEPDRLVQLASRGIRAHDPSTIVKCGDEYWLFATGNGIISWRSKDLLTWAAGPRVFTNPPAWTTNTVPGNRGYFWAPDVIHVFGELGCLLSGHQQHLQHSGRPKRPHHGSVS